MIYVNEQKGEGTVVAGHERLGILHADLNEKATDGFGIVSHISRKSIPQSSFSAPC